jgi:hypothetical protein
MNSHPVGLAVGQCYGKMQVLEFTSFWNASHPTLTLVDNNDGEEQCGALERIEEHTSELKPRSGKVEQPHRPLQLTAMACR